MKKRIIILIGSFFLFSGFGLLAQNVEYNDKVDDAALDRQEQEAAKKAPTGVADPYYEQNIKNSWDKAKEDKAKQAIEELKKEYGTDKFDKKVLDKGPLPTEEEKPWPQVYKSGPADPYYEENIKNSFDGEKREIKEELRKSVKEDIEKKKNESGDKANIQPAQTPSGSDPYYEQNIKNSWSKDKDDVVKKAMEQLKKDKAIIKEEDKKKKKKDENQ